MGRRDDDDFVEFAQAAYFRLSRAAYLLTGSRHLAEDAVQTALGAHVCCLVAGSPTSSHATQPIAGHRTTGNNTKITGLAAYGSAGHKLPTGNATTAQG